MRLFSVLVVFATGGSFSQVGADELLPAPREESPRRSQRTTRHAQSSIPSTRSTSTARASRSSLRRRSPTRGFSKRTISSARCSPTATTSTRRWREDKVRFVIMAPTEMTTDVPEQRHMKNDPKDQLGQAGPRAGRADHLVRRGEPAQPQGRPLPQREHPDPRVLARHPPLRHRQPSTASSTPGCRKAYKKAMDKGLWKDTYAATNHSEYWAEGVQSYFDCNNPPNKGVHNDINTREAGEVRPRPVPLIDETFAKNKFRYVR